MTVQDCSELGRFLEDPRYRRSWLLLKASHCETLDRALALAKRCDDFITGSAGEQCVGSAVVRVDATALQGNEKQPQVSPEPSAAPDEPTPAQATRSSLSVPERERLLSRLAAGAKNAEIAAELGLSPRQVQGIRMGCAREIQRRRQRGAAPKETTSNTEKATVLIDDVVRYLRQQDDVVVPQEGGEFLINARFRLSGADLVTRANRMRVRQGKPEFELQGAREILSRPVNGHESWRDAAAMQLASGPMLST